MIYSLIGMPQGAEWLVILVIVVLVFGAAKLPDLARSTGQALKIFKSETKGLIDDEDGSEGKDAGRGTSSSAGELGPGQGEQPGSTGGPASSETSTGQSADRHPG